MDAIMPVCLIPDVFCIQEHPDTVGGAMLTGVREAVRALRMLRGASEEEANAAAGAVDGGLPSRKRKQVRRSSITCVTARVTRFTTRVGLMSVVCVTALASPSLPLFHLL